MKSILDGEELQMWNQGNHDRATIFYRNQFSQNPFWLRFKGCPTTVATAPKTKMTIRITIILATAIYPVSYFALGLMTICVCPFVIYYINKFLSKGNPRRTGRQCREGWQQSISIYNQSYTVLLVFFDQTQLSYSLLNMEELLLFADICYVFACGRLNMKSKNNIC